MKTNVDKVSEQMQADEAVVDRWSRWAYRRYLRALAEAKAQLERDVECALAKVEEERPRLTRKRGTTWRLDPARGLVLFFDYPAYDMRTGEMWAGEEA